MVATVKVLQFTEDLRAKEIIYKQHKTIASYVKGTIGKKIQGNDFSNAKRDHRSEDRQLKS